MADRSHTSRLAAYKNAGQGTPTELRRKRAELSITLRKQARDEQLLKRRITSPEPSEPQEAEKTMTPAEIVQGLKSNDVIIMSAAARAARRMLSREQNPPISSMLEAGVLKPLVSALDRDDCEDLQFEAAWAITNIASGTHEQTVAVIDSGALPKLVLLLSRGGPLGEQSAWALGNVAGDGAQPRDVVLAQGALPALLPMLTRATALSQLKTAVWAYSNFCRHKNPLVNFDLVAPALPYLTELLTHSEPDVLVDICWALSYLTDGPNERIEQVQTTQHLLPRLVNLLQHKSPIVLTPALRATGNMLTGSDLQTDRCLEAGCLEHLAALLRCGRAALVKEAAWAASNVLAGTQAQIQAAVDAGLLNHLVHVLHTGDIKSKKEAAWGITNLTMGGTPAQLDALMSAGFLEPYCGLLESTDLRAIVVVLDGISNLLQAADKFGQVEPLCIALEEIQVLGVIENLQNHPNDEIYQKSAALISTYFSDPDDLAAQPDANDDEFQFTASQDNQNIRF